MENIHPEVKNLFEKWGIFKKIRDTAYYQNMLAVSLSVMLRSIQVEAKLGQTICVM